MKRLVVLAVIGGAVFSVTDRNAHGSALQPTVDWIAHVAGPHLKPLVDPVLRWSTRSELRALERDLRKRQESFQPLPHPSRFAEHIQQHHLSGRGGRDAWGGEYYLVITLDSVIVGSPGADGVRNTSEDLRISWPRDTASSWRPSSLSRLRSP